MRRVVILLTLMMILGGLFRLSRLSQDWHYVVPAAPGQVIYATTFDAFPDDWEQEQDRFKSSEIVDGVLRLQVGQSQAGIYSAVSPYLADFDFEVDARAVAGPEDNGYGVVFRQRDRDSYYLFLISTDGYYRVKRVVDGESRVLSNWVSSSLIRQGIGQVNRIRVIGSGGRFRFFVNGSPVELCLPNNPGGESTPLPNGECMDGRWTATLADDTIAFGRVGAAVEVDLAQEPGVIVEFDNAIVLGPLPFEE